MNSSLFSRFYKKNFTDRLTTLEQAGLLSTEEAEQLLRSSVILPQQLAEHMIENQISTYSLPLGLAFNFLIDGKEYAVPMAIEEPSVVAAANYAAKVIRQSGGFETSVSPRRMIGQVALKQIPDLEEAVRRIQQQKDRLLQSANDAHPSIVERGGGARELEIRIIEADAEEGIPGFLVVHFFIETLEAMGANIVNTMMEAVSPLLEDLTAGSVLMGILSNYATECLATATCRIPPRYLRSPLHSGEEVRDRIVEASQFAWADPYRAATNNKGVFNGIDAVVLATGNDWRAIEAGGHAYAAGTGQYRSLTKWTTDEEGNLVGRLTLPLPIGTVGGSIGIHPQAQLSKKILQYESAEELESIIVSVGLAQNFAALKALVTEGIQRGHMALQAKSLAISAGAAEEEIPLVTERLKQAQHRNLETAKKILTEIRLG